MDSTMDAPIQGVNTTPLPFEQPSNKVAANINDTPLLDSAMTGQPSTEQRLADQPNTSEPADPIVDYSELVVPEEFANELAELGVVDRFKDFCAQTGLSAEQAQKAMDFYAHEQVSAMGQAGELCEMSLRSHWKEQFSQKIYAAKQACAAFDKRMNGRLMPLVEAGLGNNPVFGELMAEIGSALSEDSFVASHGAPAQDKAMSTEDFLRKVVFNNQ